MTPEQKYNEYLDRYCRNKNVTREEAERHAVVMIVKKFYFELE